MIRIGSKGLIVLFLILVVTLIIPFPGAATHINCDTTTWNVEAIHACDAQQQVPLAAQRQVDLAILDRGLGSRGAIAATPEWEVFVSEKIRTGSGVAVDGHGHGTSVTSVISGGRTPGDRNHSLVGISPHVDIYTIKIFGRYDSSPASGNLSKAIRTAVKGPDNTIGTRDDADVISMSFTRSLSHKDRRTLEWANRQGTVLVTGSGNEGEGDITDDDLNSLERNPNTIVVGPLTRRKRAPTFASSGDAIDIAAPGYRVPTIGLGGQLRRSSGGSIAAPHVAGALALMIGADLADGNRDLSEEELRSILVETATDTSETAPTEQAGSGHIHVLRAVQTVSKVHTSSTVATRTAGSTRTKPLTKTPTRSLFSPPDDGGAVSTAGGQGELVPTRATGKFPMWAPLVALTLVVVGSRRIAL
jgi:hypothetical protein